MQIREIYAKALSDFRSSLDAWGCDTYSCDMRYIAFRTSTDSAELLAAEVVFYPTPFERDNSFQTTAENLVAGQLMLNGLVRPTLFDLLESIAKGVLRVGSCVMTLPNRAGFLKITNERPDIGWLNQPTIQVEASQSSSLPDHRLLDQIDQRLRLANIPFDGMDDLVRWLAVPDPRTNRNSANIRAVLHPPCQIATDVSAFSGDILRLTVRAHPALDIRRTQISVISFPGETAESRLQLGSKIKWKHDETTDVRIGEVEAELPHAERALVMVSIGDSCVQRHWFANPLKSQDARLTAVRSSDPELKMLRRYLLNERDQDKFELGVALLAFLKGFNPAVQVEKDAPDILLVTPGGQLIVMECTLQTKDVNTKVGKLIDRLHALDTSLKASKQSRQILAVLVTQQQRAQVALTDEEIKAKNFVLLTHEDLELELGRTGIFGDVDDLVSSAIRHLASAGTARILV